MPLNLQLRNQNQASVHQARPQRNRTCLIGKLVYGEGTYMFDCAIRDISEGGAKIILNNQQPLPPNLFLIVAKYCVAYQAKIMWLKFPARGLKFSKKYLLNETLPDELKFLRQLWVNLFAGSVTRTIADQWEVGELAARCDSTH